MPAAITVENLSKKYLIRHKKAERYTALRDVLAEKARVAGRALLRPLRGVTHGDSTDATREEFWALKDVDFEIQEGDRVGVIGRNGAGKSTLLKILSRVTEPTNGRIGIRGRVASLLEVGTGFHPELTGRENIYLNGAVLGMSKAEIAKRFDEIVAFAEVEQFLDTPVKRYSSGMYLRLAFAVAAHLEPDILLVDEVLAVGDPEFQKKCLGRLESVAANGRTVLFVSHNMGAVLHLCQKGILLERGRSQAFADVAECVARYRQVAGTGQAAVIDLDAVPRPAQYHLLGSARFVEARMANNASHGSWRVPFPELPVLELAIRVTRSLSNMDLGIALFNVMGQEVASSLSTDTLSMERLEPGSIRIVVRYDSLTLVPGRYSLTFELRSDSGVEDRVVGAVEFEVMESDESGRLRTHHRRGVVIPYVSYDIQVLAPTRGVEEEGVPTTVLARP